MLEKNKLLSGEEEKMVIIKGTREAVSALLRVCVELEVRTKSFAGLQCWKTEGRSSNKLQRIAQNVFFFKHQPFCPEHCGICPDKQFASDSGRKKALLQLAFHKKKGSRLLMTELPEWAFFYFYLIFFTVDGLEMPWHSHIHFCISSICGSTQQWQSNASKMYLNKCIKSVDSCQIF